MMPTSVLDELRSLPENIIGNSESLEGNYEPKYTGKVPNMEFLIHLIRSDLTHSLSKCVLQVPTEAESIGTFSADHTHSKIA